MNCSVPGCRGEAVAQGLCAKHYMRLRRRGDPNAGFPVGRQPRPKPADPELDALRRDNAALREQVAALLKAAGRDGAGAQAPRGARDLFDHLAAVVKERDRLAREVAALRAASRVAPDEVNAVARLVREVEALKARLAASPDDRVAKLERELKGARTRINHLKASSATAWAASRANPAAIAKADHLKLVKAFHPDGEARASDARKAQLTEAFQIFNGLKFNIVGER
jgi:hypothetical protein